MKGKRIVLGVLLVIGLPLVVSAGQPSQVSSPAPKPAKTFTLKASGYGGPTYSIRVEMERAHKLIQERSNGRIKIDWFPDQSLVKMEKTTDAIQGGIIDIGITSPTHRPDLFGAAADIVNMPFNWDEQLFGQKYRTNGFWDFIEPYWEKNGMVMLSLAMAGSHELGSVTPIRKLADFKGKIIRVGAPAIRDFVKVLGATPSSIPTSELYQALQRKTIDGNVTSLSGMRTLNLEEVCPYFTFAGFTNGHLTVVMSKKVREGMPADLVKIVDDAYLDAEKDHYKSLPKLVQADIDYLKKAKGVKEMIVISDAERANWIKAGQTLYDAYQKKWGSEWDKFWKIRQTMVK